MFHKHTHTHTHTHTLVLIIGLILDVVFTYLRLQVEFATLRLFIQPMKCVT